MDFREIINSFKNVSDSTIAELSEIADIRQVKKGECIIQQGRLSTGFIFIKKGIFRLWFVANGKERTIGFGCPGDPFTSIHTFRTGKPAILSFEAVTDSEVYFLEQRDVKRLMDSNKEFSDWMISFMIEQLDALYLKQVIFGTHNATKRYEAFIMNRRDICYSVPLKYIAQYLNIAPETLSRIQSSAARSK